MEDLVCKCGNTTASDGFVPCDKNGCEMEPTIDSDWNGEYVCLRCGEIHILKD